MANYYDPTQPMAPLQAAAVQQNFQAPTNPAYTPITGAASAGVGGVSGAAAGALPGVAGAAGAGAQKAGFFSQGGGAGLALSGLATIGSLWSAFQQNKLAKKSLQFQKDAFNINLANSTKQYNTSLEDRVRARYATEGRSDQADGYIARNRLSTPGV